MADVGRNDPCPCGSGKKHKRCCYAREEASAERPPARDPGPLLDDRLTPDLLEYASDSLGEEYDPGAVFEGRGGGDHRDGLIFIPWALYHYPVDGKTVVEWFLADRGPHLGRAKRRWLESQQRALLSYWEVTEVESGRGLHLRCLLTGKATYVREMTASRLLSRWNVLLARVVEYDGRAYIVGCHERAMPPALGAEARDRVREALGAGEGAIPQDQVRHWETALLLVREWYAAVKEQDAPRPLPGLANTDGHELVLVTDRHSFDPARRGEIVAALSAMRGAEPDLEEAGELRISFTRPGNSQFGAWDNTVVGTGIVGPDTLTLETNSAERAAALLRRVRKACPGLLTPESRERKSVEHLLRQRLREPPPEDGDPPAPAPPELMAKLREFKERTNRGWLDERVPALGGLTPRAAARSGKWRPALDVLVKEIEQAEDRLPAEERIDLSFLRRELGLG